MARKVATASEIIDALGGTGATARLTKKSLQAVSNWRATGKLPAETFLVLGRALKKRGLEAPASAWGIAEATHE